jgi:hypothetical protein
MADQVSRIFHVLHANTSHQVGMGLNMTTNPGTTSIVQWPMGRMPVELFNLIASFLSRQDVKALRLTCREFEDRVSSEYFRNVVVPFRSELYGNMAREVGGGIECATTTLFTNGMRIFEAFGAHVRRFALSFEIDEDSLSFPPLKPIQQAVPAFWGIYRWPHETYHRYTDLEDIEATADEYQGMKQALRYLRNVTDLGLCCDAGLGYLLGPNARAAPDISRLRHTSLLPVLNAQDDNGDANSWAFADEAEEASSETVESANRDRAGSPPQSQVVDCPIAFKRKILEAMCTEAGFLQGLQTDEAVNLLLETEGVDLFQIEMEERLPSAVRVERREAQGPNFFRVRRERSRERRIPLIPTHLTRSQKELLLELEWAHRALIQSYVISIIDLSGDGCFRHLTTLSITKIPSSHLHLLYRNELWSEVATLTTVSLGVLADWRRVTKTEIGTIEDKFISPVEAVEKVFKLLHTYIGPQPHIQRLDFEWICGGEFAPSRYQRNSFVLPAPIVETPGLMVLPGIPKLHPEKLLRLPWIKHLRLKNCWASPHILLQVLRHAALSNLETLEFETVSLSGPPTMTWQPGLAQINIQPPNGGPAAAAFLTVFNPLFGPPQQQQQHQPLPPQQQQIPPAGAPAPTFVPMQQIVTWAANLDPPDERNRHAQLLSWAGMLDHFSPGVKVLHQYPNPDDATDPSNVKGWKHDLEMAEDFVHRFSQLGPDENRYGLRSLSVKSCGYVVIEAPYLNARATFPPDPQPNTPNGLSAHMQELAQLMQNCKDKLCGRILPYVRPYERNILEGVFGMHIGWEGVYDEAVRDAAFHDGVQFPGAGRFTGTIAAPDENPFSSDYHVHVSSDTLSDGAEDSGSPSPSGSAA